jgi:hypothetical protein
MEVLGGGGVGSIQPFIVSREPNLSGSYVSLIAVPA